MHRYFSYKMEGGSKLTMRAASDEELGRGQFRIRAETPVGIAGSFGAYSPMQMPRDVGQKILIHLFNPYTQEASYMLTPPVAEVLLDHVVSDVLASE